MTFKTKILEIKISSKDLQALDQFKGCSDVECLISSLELRWEAEIDLRAWGIKEISAYIPAQSIDIEVSYLDKDSMEKIENVRLEVRDVKIIGPQSLTSLVPISLELYNGKWEVEFA